MWNTLKLFIRSLNRKKTISIITIGGYAISMAVILILVLFIMIILLALVFGYIVRDFLVDIANNKCINNVGFNVFDHVIGRTSDRVVTTSGKVLIYFDFIFNGLEDLIERYRINQNDNKLLIVEIVLRDRKQYGKSQKEMEIIINKNLSTITGDDLQAELVIKEAIISEGTWKRRHIVSKQYFSDIQKFQYK